MDNPHEYNQGFLHGSIQYRFDRMMAICTRDIDRLCVRNHFTLLTNEEIMNLIEQCSLGWVVEEYLLIINNPYSNHQDYRQGFMDSYYLSNERYERSYEYMFHDLGEQVFNQVLPMNEYEENNSPPLR